MVSVHTKQDHWLCADISGLGLSMSHPHRRLLKKGILSQWRAEGKQNRDNHQKHSFFKSKPNLVAVGLKINEY